MVEIFGRDAMERVQPFLEAAVIAVDVVDLPFWGSIEPMDCVSYPRHRLRPGEAEGQDRESVSENSSVIGGIARAHDKARPVPKWPVGNEPARPELGGVFAPVRHDPRSFWGLVWGLVWGLAIRLCRKMSETLGFIGHDGGYMLRRTLMIGE